MRARRAFLYVPGDDLAKIEAAISAGVDCVCLDLEDGVAPSRKEEARHRVAQVLQTMDFGRSERWVRINPVGSGLADADLATILPARPDGIVVPKSDTAEPLGWVSWQMAQVEGVRGWPVGELRLMALVETPGAVLNLPQICVADARLEALLFGAEDLAANLGAIRTPAAWEVFYARSAVVLHAAAYGLQALDMLNLDYVNLEAVRQEARLAAEMGFSGKQVVHPDQVCVVQDAFTPDDAAIAQAQQLVATFQNYQAEGTGLYFVNGRMVDLPEVKMAENLLARARAAGKSC